MTPDSSDRASAEPPAGAKNSDRALGRRGFIKSIFGLKTVMDAPGAMAERRAGLIFIWTDLRTGQVGFPTGLTMRAGRPGSLMKLVAAAALCQEQKINPNHTTECPGHVTVDRQTFNCQFAHGKVNLVSAIARSCNVFFVDAVKHLPAETFLHYAGLFGLNKPVIGSPSGAFPLAPHHPCCVYALGLAEDLVPSPLQILRMSAMIALKGDGPAMHSAESPERPDLHMKIDLKPGTWSVLKSGMELSGRRGTAEKIDPDYQLHVAAKTGTVANGPKFESWVTGYFPAENPRNAFCLFSPYGTSVDSAVPKAHELLSQTVWP